MYNLKCTSKEAPLCKSRKAFENLNTNLVYGIRNICQRQWNKTGIQMVIFTSRWLARFRMQCNVSGISLLLLDNLAYLLISRHYLCNCRTWWLQSSQGSILRSTPHRNHRYMSQWGSRGMYSRNMVEPSTEWAACRVGMVWSLRNQEIRVKTTSKSE